MKVWIIFLLGMCRMDSNFVRQTEIDRLCSAKRLQVQEEHADYTTQ